MRFKHTINVLIDNFRVTYKLLVYLLIVVLITTGLGAAIVVPFFDRLGHVEYYTAITEAVRIVLREIIHGNFMSLPEHFETISTNFTDLLSYLSENPGDLVLSALGLVFVALISRFLISLGNYTACALINDKMAMQANSSFCGALIKNLGNASLYSVIYMPISFVYDVACVVVLYLILSAVLGSSPIIAIFLFLFSAAPCKRMNAPRRLCDFAFAQFFTT